MTFNTIKLVRKFIFIFLFLCSSACVSTKPTPDVCNSFKSGKYVQYMYNNSGLGHWTKMTLHIDIRDSFQIVTREYPIRDTQISRLKWPSPCKFNSLWINPKTDLDSASVKIYPKGTNYSIKKVTSKYILVKSRGQVDTIWKTN